jgi:hypothetical protein
MEASKCFDGVDGIVVLRWRDLLLLDTIDNLYTSSLPIGSPAAPAHSPIGPNRDVWVVIKLYILS